MKKLLLISFLFCTLFVNAQWAHYTGWGLRGTTLGNNTSFIGSTDNRSWYGYSNNTKRFKLDSLGNFISYYPICIGDGSSPIAGTTNFRLNRSMTGASSFYSFYHDSPIASDVTTTAVYYQVSANTASTGGTYTVPDVICFNASQGSFGSGSSVTNQWGFVWNGASGASTINAGFRGRATAGSTKWNIYCDGSAQNYIAGSVGIATTTPSEKLHVIGAIRTSSTTNFLGGSTIVSNGTQTYTQPASSGTYAIVTQIPFLIQNASLSSNFSASTTYYFGMYISNNSGYSQGVGRVEVPYDCTLTNATAIVYVNGVSASNPALTATISCRIDNTTDVVVTSAATFTSVGAHYNTTALTQTIASGSYIETKLATPAWTVNPTSTAISVIYTFARR